MSNLTRLTRQELYDLVWSEPVVTIAGRHGVSGRAIGKLCERRRIPVPPRGYWAKAAAGKAFTKPDLPDFVERPKRVTARDRDKSVISPSLAALIARCQAADNPPEEPDPPTKDYRFRVTTWDWDYSVGAPGPALPLDSSREEMFPEFEDYRLNGVLLEPPELLGEAIALFVAPTPGHMHTMFRETSRAHVGAIESAKRPICARVVIPENAAARLQQFLIANSSVSVCLTTEPDGLDTETIMAVHFFSRQVVHRGMP